MDAMPMYIGSGIGAMLILLGFVALLTQKIYMDPSTNGPVEVEIPIFGKMKANYPALVFVFLGCVLVYYGLNQYKGPRDVRWQIDGTIVSDAPGLNWQRGRLVVFPTKVIPNIEPDTGRFTIYIEIESGKAFEDVIELIDYTHPQGNVQIIPKKELDKYSKEKSTQLVSTTPTTRTYKAHLVRLPEPLKP